MHFLPDVYVPCEVCHGKRYNRETLEVTYKGKSISDVLDMTVEDALSFFENIPKIKRKLQTLADVGLGYVTLGQPATTLSGGEAQRVKLASELHKRSTGRTLYILDEPTTGLHVDDIARLLVVLQRLVDNGDTVLVIEHNLDIIKTADYIVDLGPEGGAGGGTIVASGTPEEVVEVKESYTGRYLKPVMERDRKRMKTLLAEKKRQPRNRSIKQPKTHRFWAVVVTGFFCWGSCLLKCIKSCRIWVLLLSSSTFIYWISWEMGRGAALICSNSASISLFILFCSRIKFRRLSSVTWAFSGSFSICMSSLHTVRLCYIL